MSRLAAAFLSSAVVFAIGGLPAVEAKDQSRIEAPAQPAPPPATQPDQQAAPQDQTGEDPTQPQTDQQPGASQGEEISPDDLSLGEFPAVQTVELTTDMAKRAVDAFVLVRDKYKEANLEDYENLQDFVDQTEQGKAFEADIKAAGFANVTEWNTAVTSVGLAYSAITEDQTDEVKRQIAEVEKDTTIAQDIKDKMIASLKAMIPSDNNRKVVQSLIDDPAYVEKLKLLAEEE